MKGDRTVLVLAAMATPAWANPSAGGELVVISLFIETIAVAVMARTALRAVPIWGTWVAVTAVTWLLMILGIYGVTTLMGLDELRPPTTWYVLGLFEAAVIAVEAVILKWISTIGFFRKPETPPMRWAEAAFISIAANLLSLAVPLLLIAL